MLKIGQKAPEFCLPNEKGDLISLNDFLGKNVVLYFYPKDNTPGCTKEALAYKEDFEEYQKLNYEIIGISKDSVNSHKKFSEKYDLPFMLLSDISLKTLIDYEVWAEKKLYGKTYMGILRTTYVIDKDGIIVDVYENVKPDKNSNEILCKIKL